MPTPTLAPRVRRRPWLRRTVAGLAAAAAVTTGGIALDGPLGGDVAGADTGTIVAPEPEPVAIVPNPMVIRWMRAVAVCSEMYPPGTDIRACIAHLY